MRTTDVEILMVPGWTGSGPDHWQSRWLGKLRTSRRVQQDDWDVVNRAKWTGRVLEAIAAAKKPVVLVAHSCGVATVVHAASQMTDGKVIGAYLVAPTSEAATARIPDIDPDFASFPREPLPFPSWIVASQNDPHCSFEEAGDLAIAWGSKLIDAGEVEHINTASGHGPWPEGAMQFGLFLKQLG
jgi:predicted alpha/beta hydrolase family esterase